MQNSPFVARMTVLLVLGLTTLATAQSTQQTAPPTIDPLRYEEDILAFESKDRVNPPPEGAIVITGSSSIRRWHNSIVKDLAPLTIIPRGFGGSTMKDALHFIDRLAIKHKPRAVVVYEGDNDTGRYLVPPSTIVDQFIKIVDKIHKALPETRVYVLSVKPSVLRQSFWDKARETNELLKKLVAGNDLLTYIDVATPLLDINGEVMTDIFVDDNLHLNEKGTQIWAATIRAALMKGEAQFESGSQ